MDGKLFIGTGGSNAPITTEDKYLDEPVQFDEHDEFLLAFNAGVERQNYASSWVNREIRGFEQPVFKANPDYLPFDDEANRLYPPAEIAKARSAEEAEYIRAAIDREYEQLKIINGNSGGMIGEIFGGIFQPHVLVGGAVQKIGVGGIALLEGGLEIGSEVLLHQMQRTRTMQESLLNIGSVAAGTLILGAAAKGYTRGKDTFKGDTPEVDDLGVGDNFPGAAGAARVGLSAEDAALASDTAAGGAILNALAVGPGARLTRSQSAIARQLGDELADKGYYTNAMAKGETQGQTIESKINQRQGEVITTLDNVAMLQKDSGLDFPTFDVELGKALSNKGQHTNPKVVEAAGVIRSQILEPRRQALNEFGAEIGEKPLGAKSYFPRIYNRQAIIDNYDAIKRDLVKLYRKEFSAGRTAAEKGATATKAKVSELNAKVAEGEAKLAKLEAAKTQDKMAIQRVKNNMTRWKKALKEASAPTPKIKPGSAVKTRAAEVVREQQRISKEVEAEADRAARDTIQNMLGGLPIGHGITGGTPSPLKARTVKLTDKMLEGYRELSATNVISKYAGSMDPYLIMRDSFGDEMLTDKLTQIGKEYQTLIDAAQKDPKKITSLRKQMARDIKDIEQMRDRLLHRVQRSVDPASGAEKIVQFIKTFNVATQLGGIALSSIPDIARPLTHYGLRSFGVGMARGMKQYIKSTAIGGSVPNLQARRMGVAAQRTQNSRLMDMAELGEPSSKVTAGMQKWWGKLTGFDHWTDAMESIAAQAAMDWTLRMAKKVHAGAPLSRSETMKVARMGFTQDDLGRFLEASKRTGGADDPVLMFANTLEWGDIDLARHFEAGIGSDVRRAIVRIGVGDKPRLMDNNIYSLIFQYQSFALAATNRMLVAGLQQRDMALVSGLLVSAALGMTVGASKSWLRGQDPFEKDDWEFFREGIDRSGILGVYNVAFNHIRNVAGDAPSRYAHLGPVSVLGGSTIGQAERLASMASAVQTGEGGEALKQASYFAPSPLHLRELMLRLGE